MTVRRILFHSGCAAFLLLGCSQQGPTDEIPDPVSQEEQKLEAEEPKPERGKHFRTGPHAGPGFLLHAALRELALRPEQKSAIEAEIAKLGVPRSSAAHEAFGKALARGVRTGKLDAASLEPELQALEKAALAERSKVSDALSALHQILDAEQRKALVSALEAKRPDFAKGVGRHHGPEMGMLRGLDLTDAQRDQLRALKQDRMATKHEHMKKLFESFAGERFDSKELAGPEPRKHALAKVEGLSALIGVLDPAQREKLATRLEAGPGKLER